MTSPPPPPPVPLDRSHEVWASSLKGALSQAQHLALEQLRPLNERDDPALRKVAMRAREALADGDAEGLAYADRLLEKAGPAGADARRLIVTQYECRADPRGRAAKLEPRTFPIHQVIEPDEWPVWVRFQNAQGEPVSGPLWVDEVNPPPQAEDAPTPLSAEEYKRLYDADKKRREREQAGGVAPISRSRPLNDALEDIRGARADWDGIMEGLAGNPAAKLLQGHRLPARLDRALAFLTEVVRGDEGGRRPGRPAGELSKATPRLEARKDELKRDYDAGVAFADLEEKYGTSHVTIRGFVKKQGWPERGVRQPARRGEPAIPRTIIETRQVLPAVETLPPKATPTKKSPAKGKGTKKR